MKSSVRKIAVVVSVAGLLCILVPAVQYFVKPASFDRYLLYVQVGTVLWFISSPFWLIKKDHGA